QELPIPRELRVAGVLGEEEDRVAEDVQDDEGEDRDADDDDDQLDELTGDVASHDGRRDGGGAGGASSEVGYSEREAPPLSPPRCAYFGRGVTRNMRSISSRGAWYSTRFEMPQTPR